MSLKKLKFASHKLETPMGVIVLRGLSLPHMRAMLRDNPAEMALVYDHSKSLYEQYQKNPDDVDLADLLGVVVQTAPKLVAHAIALSTTDGEADEEEVAIAEKLPLDIQLECVEKIATLTFAMEGGARSFFAKVVQLMKSLNTLKADNGAT